MKEFNSIKKIKIRLAIDILNNTEKTAIETDEIHTFFQRFNVKERILRDFRI
jgi:hypothetical protein